MLTREELLAKARKPSEDAMLLHPFYKGKIEVVSKCAVRDFDDFAIWYTPGVAAPCRAIAEDKELVYIGPEAAMPVMEGKALLFKYLGGVDAVPVCLDTKDADQFIATVKLLQPSFGGINLEDIAQPKCFRILDTLRKEMQIPVWHDDQQGTAAVTTAGLINALRLVGKSLSESRVAMVGAGASNICIARVLITAGVSPGNIIMCDSKGTLHPGRTELKDKYKEKWEMCQKTNKDRVEGGPADAMKGADVLIALSTPGPDTIKPDWVSDMASDAIVFACANPVPEIWPWDAKDAGARIVATGRSDFPNQVNNSLGFPGIFRGTLDVRAGTITDEMCIAAAYELAQTAQDQGLHEKYLIPTMDEWQVFPREAVAVGLKAIEQGVARLELSRDELYQRASEIIERARGEIQLLMDEGIIPPAPEE
jgi:malate dehydrogenase (oxaloacetate-decarboxylating)